MEDFEQPPVERSTLPRSSHACQRCRSLKTRCLPSDQPGTCQRCSVSKRDCLWAEAPRRTRRVRGPSRIFQVEQKIDGLVATLVNTDVSKTAANDRPSETSQSSGPGNHPPNAQSNRPHAPGSWLPVAPSLEQQVSHNDQDAEIDQRYLENLEAIHSFGDDQPDLGSAPAMFNNSAPNEPPINSELIEKFFSGGDADAMIKEYNTMFESFPFVPIPSQTSARDLNAAKPMLFLAVLTATSWNDHQLQRKIDRLYREELANRTIIQPRRTLSLLQSLLVYLAWYHFVFSHKTQQIYSLMQLAIGLSLDLGMHQENKQLPVLPGRSRRRPPSAEEQRERHRAFLGCYYLSSALSMALMKPNLLKYTDYMGKVSQRLMYDREYESDETISSLISLRRLDDQIYESLNGDDTVDLPITDSRIYMSMRFLETQLEDWKVNNTTTGMSKTLELSRAFTDMQLHAIALRPTDESQPMGQGTIQLSALLCTLEAGKRFLDTLVAFPAAEYHVICFSEWMRVPHVISTMSRLCIPNDWHASIQWDAKAAQERVRLDLYLETLCYRMQRLSTYDKAKQPHPDFWKAMHLIMDLTQLWYSRKIKATSKQTPSNKFPTPDAMASYNQANTGMSPTTNIESAGGAPGFSFPDLGPMDNSNIHAHGIPENMDFMRGMDIDMDQFLNMGIWGHETYEGMGFGRG